MTRRLLSISALASILLAGFPASRALALDEADRLWLVGERAFADGLHPIARRLRRRDRKGCGVAAGGRSHVWTRSLRPRAAAAGAGDQGLPRSPFLLAGARDGRARDLLSGANSRRAQALSRGVAVALRVLH